MSLATLARSDLFSLSQAGNILGVDRRRVSGAALALNVQFKSDPTRAGKMLDREDMDRLAKSLGASIDWDKLTA